MRHADPAPAVPAGPCATVGELIAALSRLPADTPVLVDGYEGGFTTATVSVIEVQQLRGLPDYYGEFMSIAEAADQVDRGDWSLMKGGTPPEPVGGPVTAVVLRR